MHPASDVSSFGRVDEQSDPDYFVRFVDEANENPSIVQVEEVATAELRLAPGDRVIELGCGTGDDSRALAELVGPDGEVVGIDASAAMITIARQRTEGTGLPVTFHVGDATQLDLPTGSFDAARCERLLIHGPPSDVELCSRRPRGGIGAGLEHGAPARDPSLVNRRAQRMIDLFEQHRVEGLGPFGTQAALLELLGESSSSPDSGLRHRADATAISSGEGSVSASVVQLLIDRSSLRRRRRSGLIAPNPTYRRLDPHTV